MFHCACRAARHRIQHQRKAVRSRLAYKMEHERVPDVQQIACTRRASGLRTRIHRRRLEWIGIVSQETPAVRSWNHAKLMMSHCAGVTVTAVLFTGGVTCRTTVAILSVACFGAAFAFAAEQVLTP